MGTGKLQFTLKFKRHHTATDIHTNLRHQWGDEAGSTHCSIKVYEELDIYL